MILTALYAKSNALMEFAGGGRHDGRGISSALDAVGKLDEALAAARKSFELAPTNSSCINQLAICLIESGQTDEALRVTENLPPDDPYRHINAGLAAARRGNRPEVGKQTSILREMFGDYASYQYAEFYALLGDVDPAFAALATAEKAKDPGLIGAMRDPFLKPLRKDPRMLALLERLKFPVIDPGIGKA